MLNSNFKLNKILGKKKFIFPRKAKQKHFYTLGLDIAGVSGKNSKSALVISKMRTCENNFTIESFILEHLPKYKATTSDFNLKIEDFAMLDSLHIVEQLCLFFREQKINPSNFIFTYYINKFLEHSTGLLHKSGKVKHTNMEKIKNKNLVHYAKCFFQELEKSNIELVFVIDTPIDLQNNLYSFAGNAYSKHDLSSGIVPYPDNYMNLPFALMVSRPIDSLYDGFPPIAKDIVAPMLRFQLIWYYLKEVLKWNLILGGNLLESYPSATMKELANLPANANNNKSNLRNMTQNNLNIQFSANSAYNQPADMSDDEYDALLCSLAGFERCVQGSGYFISCPSHLSVQNQSTINSIIQSTNIQPLPTGYVLLKNIYWGNIILN